ncbi:nascent polypeptide-associated complex subunit alpha, muscle-specific form-like [Schistocerca gregaria]|uniref:nascent polypeptide-associated complex subunit alpha, muscle-specific form-like n=1 Tax=Schistocerca gregaria TaxID=7010 RepID=UPI00211EDA11|nr:nascent polypeptide-associated complex subunit alpha, muscle-specific form-like [Schistocerca gregaria]
MTKKAKSKTKSDEAPPKSAPPEKQTTEPGTGPGSGQKADAAAPPQPPTSAGAGSAPQPPEAAKPKDSPASAAAIPTPAPPNAKSDESKTSEQPVMGSQAPTQLVVVGSPLERPPTDQSPSQLGVVDSPSKEPVTAQASPQLGVVGSSLEKPPKIQSPPQLEVVGSLPIVQASPETENLVSPHEKPPTAQAPPQLGVMGSPPEKPPTAEKSPQLGVMVSPPDKPPIAQAPPQLGVVASPAEKSPPPKKDIASNSEPKPSVPVQSEPPKEQPTVPQPTSQPLPQPLVGDPSLSPTPSDKTREVPIEKSQTEKSSQPIVPPKVQDPGRELADKNKKVSPNAGKAASNGQPSKQHTEKQNKRQVAKESVQTNSVQKGDPNVNKQSEIDNKQNAQDKVTEKPESSSEPKTTKDNTAAKVNEVKDKPNKNQLAGATSETPIEQNSTNEVSKKVTDAEAPKPKDSNKNSTAPTTENIKSAEKREALKDQTADGKTSEQKFPAAPGNQQKPPSPKNDPNEKVNKNAPSKKSKQKNETAVSKSEGAPNLKEVKPASKGGKKDATKTATGAEISPEVKEAPNLSITTENSKKSSSNILLETELPTLEAVASNHSAQVKDDGSKVNQQTKIATDPKDGKEGPIKDDAQSKSSGKKKSRQQKKSVSEDAKPSEAKDNKGPQEVAKPKNNEKKKSAPASPSKEKESNRDTVSAPGEKNRKNVSGESEGTGPKVSPGKSPTVEKSPVTAEKDSSDKTQVINSEPQPEEQEASKKKKRNRHKKKNKVGDNSTDANIEGGKQQDTNVTAVGGERKAKEKQQTTAPPTNKSKGQQKDSQPGQTKASKGTQPVPTTPQDGPPSDETPAKQASGTTTQTASAKKRNRRKKKGASGIEKDGDANVLPESKSAESKETSVGKPEEQKSRVNIPSTQTKTDETNKKKTDSKPTTKPEKPQQQDAQLSEGTEDQSENFVEVKSKNKRNKKKKVDSSEAKEDSAISLSSSNNVSKIGPENIVDASVSSSEGNTGTENAGGDSVKEVANKVSPPKISQEAREQKMLNKKLAERAQLKIKKQIESNALSEVEKSEKYLETITKNLRELTKLRSSRLEDVLQQPGDEEFDYEYTPVQRNTFLATTCHVCKESKQREVMKVCEQCHLMSYCSEEHQKSDWSAHKDLCQAVSEMCKERGTDNLYAPAVGLSAEEYRGYRMNALLECSAILNRQLEPYEQEIILYPNVCHTCHLPSAANLHTCESCSMVSYCSPEHRPPNHDVWCHDLQLYKSLIIYQSRNGVINPQLPVFLPESFQPLSGDMQSDLLKLSGSVDASPLERAVLSEIATGPLTALFALQKSNKVSGTTEKLVVHFVGAEWSFEMERADKWEAFLLHLIPSLKALVLVFVGPEVCSLPPEARGLLQKQSTLCPQCQEKGRTVEMVIPPQTFYHEYVASQDYIPPTIICAYNAGLYRPNGHKDIDSWSDTVTALLRDPSVPVAVTSYTAEEVLKDAERLQHHRALNFVLPPSQNPYRSLRPNRNFASDDVTPVIFKNYYIMIATSLAQ